MQHIRGFTFMRCINLRWHWHWHWQAVGCDGHVGSGLVFDNCHVCNGTNVGCRRYSGTFARYGEFWVLLLFLPLLVAILMCLLTLNTGSLLSIINVSLYYCISWFAALSCFALSVVFPNKLARLIRKRPSKFIRTFKRLRNYIGIALSTLVLALFSVVAPYF